MSDFEFKLPDECKLVEDKQEGNVIRKKYRATIRMPDDCIKVADEMIKEYKEKGLVFNPFEPKENNEHHKDFVKRVKALRRKEARKEKKAPSVAPQENTEGLGIQRRYQIALCNIAHGNFDRLDESSLFYASIVASIIVSAMDPNKYFEAFRTIVEGIEENGG